MFTLTREIMVDREFDITLEVKGNTIKITYSYRRAVDNGEVIMTAKVLSDSECIYNWETIGRLINKDSTVVLEFTTDTLVSGRTFEDIVKVNMIIKARNMGLKALILNIRNNVNV